jgi:hypothetical protein
VGIKDRLRRLEDRYGPACPECYLKPQRVYAVYPEDEHYPEVEHCLECGRSLGVVFRIVYEEEGGG